MSTEPVGRRRLLAFYIVCVGALMVILDATIVVVAVPSMLKDLHLSDTSVTWVVNSYTLTFGGFLLLSGRLGDLYGPRRLFLTGIGLFTMASFACALAQSQTMLLVGRAIQGLGGATVTAVSLSLVLNLFVAPTARAKAVGFYAFVSAMGGAAGEILGGILTTKLGWHWIFLVNVPVGAVVLVLCGVLLPPDAPLKKHLKIDFAGGIAITSALTLLAYTLVSGKDAGWLSSPTLLALGAALALLTLFLFAESRSRDPLIPLRLFRLHNFAVSNLVGVLWSAGSAAWFVISALYMQRVLGYSPIQVGLAYIPAELIMAAFSAGLSAKAVERFGVKGPLWTGMLLASVGLALFARAHSDGTFAVDILPGMILLGLGGGITSSPLLLAATADVDTNKSGLASGMVNTSLMMGGALGLAFLATLADIRTIHLHQSGLSAIAALDGGYRLAFLFGGLLATAGAILGALTLRNPASREATHALATP